MVTKLGKESKVVGDTELSVAWWSGNQFFLLVTLSKLYEYRNLCISWGNNYSSSIKLSQLRVMYSSSLTILISFICNPKKITHLKYCIFDIEIYAYLLRDNTSHIGIMTYVINFEICIYIHTHEG